jgi:hypothetical protein
MSTNSNNAEAECFLTSPYLQAFWEPDNSLIHVQWLAETKYMQDDDFKDLLSQIAQVVEAHQAKRWLANTTAFDFIITPEIQSWVSADFNQKLIAAGMTKMAVLIPASFMSEVSVHQSTDEMSSHPENGTLEFSYFSEIAAARKWLMG